VGYRLVSIRAPKGLEPARRVEHRGPGMSLDELHPPWIRKRIDPMCWRHEVFRFCSLLQFVSAMHYERSLICVLITLLPSPLAPFTRHGKTAADRLPRDSVPSNAMPVLY